MTRNSDLRASYLAPASYDLHMHTYWSYDATAEIEPYFRQARELGVRCIAITEHHNIDSAEEIVSISEKYPEVRMIVAAELTVTTTFGAIDLLCYNLPLHPSGEFAQVLEEYHEWQRVAGASQSRGMQLQGYDYSDAERLKLLQSYRPARVLERQGITHVQGGRQTEHFLKKGYFASKEEYSSRGRTPFPPYPAVERVVPAVKQADGIVVIAHPTNYFQNNDLTRMDALRHECELDGIECAHRIVPPELTSFYRDYCVKHGLISTGGSDCHHPEDIVNPTSSWEYSQERRFAGHIGEDAWLDEFLERIEAPGHANF